MYTSTPQYASTGIWPSRVQDSNSGRLKNTKIISFNYRFFLCFVWTTKISSIISINSISLFVFITYTELVKRGEKWIFLEVSLFPILNISYRGPVGLLPTSVHGCTVRVLGQNVCYLLWTYCQYERFLSEYFSSIVSGLFTNPL
jgi:hypothetical protein